jgi:hypothetical protein
VLPGDSDGDVGMSADAGALAPLHPVRPRDQHTPSGPKGPAKSTAGPAGGEGSIAEKGHETPCVVATAHSSV